MNFLEEALKYRNEYGFSIIPLKPNTKEALIRWKPYTMRKPTEGEIKKWWNRWPDANVAVICGEISNLIIVDVDPRNGGEKLRDDFVPTVYTPSGGVHYWFRYDTRVAKKGILRQGVDIQSNKSIALLPPSATNRGRYEYGSADIYDTWPEELIEEYSRTRQPIPVDVKPTVLIPLGKRHDFLVSRAGALKRKGYEIDIVIDALIRDYEKYCEKSDEDLTNEIKTIAESMGDYKEEDTPKGDPLEKEELPILSAKDFLLEKVESHWIVKNFFPQNSINFIAGLAETKKSWMLMELALSAVINKPWLNNYSVKQCRVLLIDQERSKAETQRRFKKLLKGNKVEDVKQLENLKIMSGTSINILLDRSFEAFKKKIDLYRPELILVDSFVTFHGSDENHRSSLQQVFERIKQINRLFNTTFIFLDHETKYILNEQNKDRSPNAHDMIGSSGKVAAAESVLTVRKHDEQSSMVYHTKSTCGPTQSPFFVFVEDTESDALIVKSKQYD